MIQILVRDDNDNTPEFVQLVYVFQVEEETDHSTNLGTVRATDDDKVDIGTYALPAGRAECLPSINEFLVPLLCKSCLFGIAEHLYWIAVSMNGKTDVRRNLFVESAFLKVFTF